MMYPETIVPKQPKHRMPEQVLECFNVQQRIRDAAVA